MDAPTLPVQATDSVFRAGTAEGLEVLVVRAVCKVCRERPVFRFPAPQHLVGQRRQAHSRADLADPAPASAPVGAVVPAAAEVADLDAAEQVRDEAERSSSFLD